MATPDTFGEDLGFPEVTLEQLEDLSPARSAGFLELVRLRLCAHYPDGSRSAPFVYDSVERRSMDAVVLAAHFVRDGEPWVYLRSAVRPPVRFRDPLRSPVVELATGSLWELPAGLIEPDETGAIGVLAAARRELEEELGFRVATAELTPLGPSVFSCPGVLGERNFFLSVEVNPERRGEPSLDGSALERFGRVLALPLARALALCASGAIEDAKTELGLRRLADALSPTGVAPGDARLLAAVAPGGRAPR
jgi:ADP-ribose pyrophosphatase